MKFFQHVLKKVDMYLKVEKEKKQNKTRKKR